jgi:hypothetical protein
MHWFPVSVIAKCADRNAQGALDHPGNLYQFDREYNPVRQRGESRASVPPFACLLGWLGWRDAESRPSGVSSSTEP